MDKMNYGNDSDTHGEGGIKSASARNPNGASGAIKGNHAPGGPTNHGMGYSGDGGMYGDENCKHRGKSYHFK